MRMLVLDSVLDGTNGTVRLLNRYDFNSTIIEPVRSNTEPIRTDSIPVYCQYKASDWSISSSTVIIV